LLRFFPRQGRSFFPLISMFPPPPWKLCPSLTTSLPCLVAVLNMFLTSLWASLSSCGMQPFLLFQIFMFPPRIFAGSHRFVTPIPLVWSFFFLPFLFETPLYKLPIVRFPPAAHTPSRRWHLFSFRLGWVFCLERILCAAFSFRLVIQLIGRFSLLLATS